MLFSSCRLSSLPWHSSFFHDLRAVHLLSQLESQCGSRKAVHRSGQLPTVVLRPGILGRHAEHGVLRCGGLGTICNRVRTCDSLNQPVRGRKFFRVVFLLPFMLSPVAVSFMIGKTLLNSQYGPVVPALHWLGIADISFYRFLARSAQYHDHGCLVLDSVYDGASAGGSREFPARSWSQRRSTVRPRGRHFAIWCFP